MGMVAPEPPLAPAPDPFPWGVASGDPTNEGAVIWSVVAMAEVSSVEWWVKDAGGATCAAGRVAVAEDRSVRTRVRGLEPGTPYSYGFVVGQHSSQVGKFRTLPVSGPLRVAFLSCAKHNAGYFVAYRHLARRSDIDLVVHLGDFIYEAANRPPLSQTPGRDIGRDFEPDHECRTAADYDRRYDQYHRDADLRELRAAHAMWRTVDDHEFADNAWQGGATEHDERLHGPWALRRNAAMEAWSKWTPTDRVHPAERHAVIDAGSTLGIALLDLRTNRTQPDDPSATLLGEPQRELLESFIASSLHRWQLVASPVLFASLGGPRLPDCARMALTKLKIATDAGPSVDGWAGYPADAAAVLAAAGSASEPMVLVSGDSHVALDLEVVYGEVAVREVMTPSVTSQNLAEKLGPGDPDLAEVELEVASSLDAVNWCSLGVHGYLTVLADQEQLTVEWWGTRFVDVPDGSVERLRAARLVHDDVLERQRGT